MSHRHFTRDDRVSLVALLHVGTSYAAMSPLFGFAATFISREITRGGGKESYTASKAQKRAYATRFKANQTHRILHPGTDLTTTITCLLELGWSTEQIVGRVTKEQEEKVVGHDLSITSAATIYSYVNARPELSILLPRKHSKYRRRHGISDRQKKRAEVSPKRDIELRPPEVAARAPG